MNGTDDGRTVPVVSVEDVNVLMVKVDQEEDYVSFLRIVGNH